LAAALVWFCLQGRAMSRFPKLRRIPPASVSTSARQCAQQILRSHPLVEFAMQQRQRLSAPDHFVLLMFRAVLWSPVALVLLVMGFSALDASYLSIPLKGLVEGRVADVQPIVRGWIISALVTSALGCLASSWLRSLRLRQESESG
jgi:hypothetical protein